MAGMAKQSSTRKGYVFIALHSEENKSKPKFSEAQPSEASKQASKPSTAPIKGCKEREAKRAGQTAAVRIIARATQRKVNRNEASKAK